MIMERHYIDYAPTAARLGRTSCGLILDRDSAGEDHVIGTDRIVEHSEPDACPQCAARHEAK